MLSCQHRRQKSSLHPFVHLLIWGGLATFLPGCGSQNANQVAKVAVDSGTFSDVYQNYLGTPACTNCHQPGQTAATEAGVNLDFTSQANAYAGLVTNAATNHVVGQAETTACQGIPLVSAGNPAASYLLAITVPADNSTSNFNGQGCTPDNTHIAQWPASDAMAASMTAWIQNGAQNN